MPRYRLTIEYDGRPYKGFQAQGELPTVQGALERAVLAFTGQSVRLQAAGRTDTGVHATGQVVHVDLDKAWPVEPVRNALNAHLIDEAVVVLEAEEAIEAAERFMRGEGEHNPVGLRTADAIDQRLRGLLGGADRFWPRWLVKTGQV